MLVQHAGLAAKLVRLVSLAIRTTLKLVQMDTIWTSFKIVRLTSLGFQCFFIYHEKGIIRKVFILYYTMVPLL